MSKEISQVFKAEVFQVLAKELWRRYYLKKEFGSSIGLSLFQKVDDDPLRGLLGITALAWSKKKRITTVELETALKESRMNWTITEFVELVTRKKLSVKAEEEAEEQRLFAIFLGQLRSLDPLFEEKLTSKQLFYWFQKGEESLPYFQQVSQALKILPQEFVRIPVFAYQQTGDAHAFDEQRPTGKLFLEMLEALSVEKAEVSGLSATEQKNRLLEEFYLLRDDMMNYVATRGLVASKKGVVNEMWRQSCIEGCSWNIPLKEILRMTEIRPFTGDKVLIVENSGVFSILVELLPEVPILCSSGQFTYAVWRMLRKLVESQAQLYYVGDMDPEGLLMAQRLIDAFPEHLQTIAMNLTTYQKIATTSELSAARIKQLQRIKDPMLASVAEKIKETHQIALQEGFLTELMNDIEWEFAE